nr:type II toxin-antitoxin system ParD family antitoxin [Colwellia maritima]
MFEVNYGDYHLSLGVHWEVFINNEVSGDRLCSVSEVVRDALLAMEERKNKLEGLRYHLAEGATRLARGTL